MTTPPKQSYRLIPLTQGKFAKVDSVDFERLSQWKWCAQRDSVTGKFYAMRNGSRKSEIGKKLIGMHREVMGLEYGDKRMVDHIEIDETLDNTRANLRIVTSYQNSLNSHRRSHNELGFKGVGIDKRCGRIHARITVNGKIIWLGYYSTAEAAHEAYKQAALQYFGEYACFS